MKIAMYGSGAAGSVFASYLKKGGADMILIDRYEAHMKKVAEDGMHFTIHQEENGAYTDYNYQLKGFRTYTSSAAAEEAEGKVDVIIYMTKATQLEQAIQDSLPVVGDTTVAVSLINASATMTTSSRSSRKSAASSAPAFSAPHCPNPVTAFPLLPAAFR